MVSKMKLVNLMEDCGVFLFRFHLHDHGCHPQPHRWIRDEPDRRGDKDRDDRAGEKASKADGSQRAPKDNLGRNRRRSEERDEPEPLDPPIVNRRLSQVEQPMIPFDESRQDDRESLSTVRTKSLAVDYQASTLAAGPSLGRFKVLFPEREALAPILVPQVEWNPILSGRSLPRSLHAGNARVSCGIERPSPARNERHFGIGNIGDGRSPVSVMHKRDFSSSGSPPRHTEGIGRVACSPETGAGSGCTGPSTGPDSRIKLLPSHGTTVSNFGIATLRRRFAVRPRRINRRGRNSPDVSRFWCARRCFSPRYGSSSSWARLRWAHSCACGRSRIMRSQVRCLASATMELGPCLRSR